jgi:SAM-dependent methyltransferase
VGGNTRAFDAATLRFYGNEAEAYTASGPGGPSRDLEAFLRRLTPGCEILDLGCGGGRDAQVMASRGFIVDATDGSPEIAHQAAERTGLSVRVMRFDELEAIARYDAVWAHASLLHVPRPALPEMIERIFRALRPGGLHYTNFKCGPVDGRDRLGRYYNYCSGAELVGLYRASAPWEIVATDEYAAGSYQGEETLWTAITVRKPVP